MTHYHPKLGEILHGTNNGSEVAINHHFADWQEVIEDDLRRRKRWKSGYQDSEEEKRLFRFAREHRDHYGKAPIGGEVLVLIHPLYLPLTNMHYVKKEEHKTETEDYLHTLLRFLGKMKEKRDKDASVILFDTLYHYAAASSLLLERGLVDTMVFTRYDHGDFYEGEDVELGLKRKTIFAGGAYNGRCFTGGIDALWDIIEKNFLWFIPEIILNHPSDINPRNKDRDRLSAQKIYCYHPVPKERMISLERLAQRWNL